MQPIPEQLTSAFRKGLDFVRTEAEDGSIPDTSHDACIVNYYPIGDERVGATSGRLGVHQDKDEASNVIARGDPIVSLSIGAGADFAYGADRFEFDIRGKPVSMEVRLLLFYINSARFFNVLTFPFFPAHNFGGK